MRVLLCGGGTAGHVMPAIAMGQIIERGFPRSKVAYAGRVGGGENKAYEASGRPVYTLDICGLSRSLNINCIKSIIKILKSGRKAREIIKDFKPDIIIGTGGYVCYPFIRQGQRLGIKTVIHESNVSPGLVTKLLHRRCDRVMINLEGTKKHLGNAKNITVVGNPTRSDFGKLSRTEARRKLGIRDTEVLIVSFGGSLGAQILNNTVMDMIKSYAVGDRKIRHIHSTGKAHIDKAKADFPDLFSRADNVKILPYIDDMPTVLTAADLAITRSGAITVSELCRCGTPSILIPSPNVTANHQYVNAEYMRSIGASVLIEERSLTPNKLYSEVRALINDSARMKSMSARARSACRRDTEQTIVSVISEVMSEA